MKKIKNLPKSEHQNPIRNSKCPFDKVKLIHTEKNLGYCPKCEKNFAYVENELLIEERIDGIIQFVEVKNEENS